MKKLLVVLMMFVVAGLANAAYVDDFESEALGTLTGQAGWRDLSTNGQIVAVTGGQALQNSSSSDQWPQYALDRSEDLGLTLDQDGLEMGFDFMNANSTLASCRMHFRDGSTATYSPAFGFQNTGEFMLRTKGEGGTNYLGNTLGDAITAGLYDKGDWITVSLVMTGTGFDTATMNAYNMTKGVDIPTGIENVALGANPKFHASWDRLIFRMSNSAGSTVDNAYIQDYTVPEPATLALLGLGGLLLRKKSA